MVPSIPPTWRLLAVTWAALSLLVSVSTALKVAPGSPCASVCMDSSGGDARDPDASTTAVSDIVCEDSDFTATVKGLKFRDCTDCLQNSRFVNGSESDVYWYIYNLRYAASVCLFNYPGAVQNKSFACLIPQSCGSLETAFRTGDLAANNASQLEFCTADGGKMTTGWYKTSCANCVSNTPESWYLSNFIVALDAACAQRPKPGDLVGLSATLFTKFAVNITAPPALETSPPPPPQTGMSIGTIIGIAIGAALLLLGGVALFVVYWRKQRRLKMQDEHRANNDSPNGGSSVTALAINGSGPGSGGGMHQAYTMDHQKAYSLTSFDQKDPQGGGRGIYGSSGDYYDQLEKQQQVAQKFGVYPTANSVGAIPAHPAYIPRAAIVSHTRQRDSTDSRGSRNPSVTQQHGQQQHYQPSHQTSALQQQLQQQQQQTRGASPRSTPRATPEPIVLAAPPPGKSRYTKTTAAPAAAESYAMQQYLAGSDDRPGMTMPPPPAGPPPSRQDSRRIDPSNIPPPPPPQPKIPSLILPSVPKIRVPKKYSPPQISVQEATPIDEPAGGGGDPLSRPARAAP